MDEKDLKIGEMYWTLKPFFPHHGELSLPQRPWRGKLDYFSLAEVRLALRVSDTGEAGSYACVTPGDLFLDEEAAGHAFIQNMRNYMNSLIEKCGEALHEMHAWHDDYKRRQDELKHQEAVHEKQEASAASRVRRPMAADGLFDSDAEAYTGD